MRKSPVFLYCALLLTPLVAQDLRSGLISYWPMDEVSPDGQTTPDKARNAHLTLVSMDESNLVEGRRGNALYFDGVSQYLRLDTFAGEHEGLPFQANAQKTICLWVRGHGPSQLDRRIFAEASSTLQNPLYGLGTTPSPASEQLSTFIRTDGGTASPNHERSNGAVFDDTWHHLAITDNNGAVTIYIDGQVDHTFTYSRGTLSSDILTIGAIERWNEGNGAMQTLAFFSGAIDDVALWRRVLSQEEIQKVMAEGVETPLPPIVGVDRPGPYLQGDTVTLRLETIGLEATSWQWRLNGTDIPGATGPTYTVVGLNESNQGTYSVLVNGNLASTTYALTFVSDPAPDLAQGIVSAWPLDEVKVEGENIITPDVWGGYDLIGTYMDTASLVPGRFDNALFFDNSLQQLAYRNSGLPYTAGAEFSVAFWVKADGSFQSDLRVFSESSTASNAPLFTLGTTNGSDAYLRVLIRNDANSTVLERNSTSEVFDDEWHHVVWVERNGQARLYVDGVMDATNFYYNRTGTFTFDRTTIGGIVRAAHSHWLTGAIDDVGVWNRALTWTEIQQLVSQGVPTPVVVEPPQITQHPANVSTWVGRSATFSVLYTGTAPLTFEWAKDGVPLPGQNQPVLELENLEPSHSGAYTCKITNSAGSVTSNAATLLVRTAENINSGLLSHWPLEPSDDTSPDVVSGLDFKIYGFPFFEAGVVGQSASLAGGDANPAENGDMMARLRTGVGQDIPITTREEFSISMWVRGDGFSQIDRRIFAEGSTESNNPLFTLGTDNVEGGSDRLDIFIRDNNGTAQVNHSDSFLPVFDGEWHHVVYTDYKGQGQLYVDGELDLTVTYNRSISTLNTTSIGGIQRAANSHWFTGNIDEVLVWDRELTAEEVRTLFESGVIPQPTGDLRVVSVTLGANNALQLTVATTFEGGVTYRVEASASLGLGSWLPVNDATIGPVQNGTFTVQIPAQANAARYFRVVVP